MDQGVRSLMAVEMHERTHPAGLAGTSPRRRRPDAQSPRHAEHTGLDSLGQSIVAPRGPAGDIEQVRTIRAVFAEPLAGFAAVRRLRATGFRIDLASSIDGDLIVSIQAGRTRSDELRAVVAAEDGRIVAAR